MSDKKKPLESFSDRLHADKGSLKGSIRRNPKGPRNYGSGSEDSLVLSGKRAAPKGKFCLIGVETFVGPFADFLVGDFVSKDDAIREATKLAGDMNPMYVYDDAGELLYSAGKP